MVRLWTTKERYYSSSRSLVHLDFEIRVRVAVKAQVKGANVESDRTHLPAPVMTIEIYRMRRSEAFCLLGSSSPCGE